MNAAETNLFRVISVLASLRFVAAADQADVEDRKGNEDHGEQYEQPVSFHEVLEYSIKAIAWVKKANTNRQGAASCVYNKTMAQSFVAFLRGINLGKNKQIKMDDLRGTFESMGFEGVKTILNSGNVLFAAPKPERKILTARIEKKLKDDFGHEVGVIVRSADEIQAIVESNPFKTVKISPGVALYVTFLAEKPRSDLKIPYESPLGNLRILQVSDAEAFSISLPAPGARGGDWMRWIEKEFGKKVTTRNWNTVVRILKAHLDALR